MKASHIISNRATAMFALLTSLFASTAWSEQISVGDLELRNVQQGWGAPQKDLSVDKHPLTIAGKKYAHGLGTHADSELSIDLGGRATRFEAQVGIDDEVGRDPGTVKFIILTDGKIVWQSPLIRAGDSAVPCSVDLKDVKTMMLVVDAGDDGNTFDHADWADATISYDGDKPRAIAAAREEAIRLTPPPRPEPRINSAKTFGVRPGSPFMYMIAATGDRPMKYRAEQLPPGLSLDENTGLITGTLAVRGSHRVMLVATNKLGQATRELRIECGDVISLTPPMGWNSWNCFANAVDAKKVESAADAMVASGLQQHGWTYINIDDFWQKHRDSKDATLGGPGRDAAGNIVPNPRFPDMKGLADYVHNKGLKIGIYSSPGPYTCGGCLGSFNHETQDASQYAQWGFDYLKYDWCSYLPSLEQQRGVVPTTNPSQLRNVNHGTNGMTLADYQMPYIVMRDALRSQKRDIVYSLCQYGMADVWKWGGEMDGNCWRTTDDIRDTWASLSSIGFSQAGKEAFAKPGNWNDPDMLIVGHVGWGPRLHPTRLTPNEQYTHITLWCLLASPLLIGCDMTQLDDFTLGLLTNDEVLAVNQDPLGKQAARVQQDGKAEVWAKDMEDGSKAIGLFNRGPIPMQITVDFAKLGLAGKQSVRDLWRQKDLGTFENTYTVEVPRHGAAMVLIQKP